MGATGPHFSDAELRCHGTNCNLVAPLVPVRGCGVNGCQQVLVDGLEALRAFLGKPINVHDAYRCPKHNGGTPNAAKNSQHPQGLAADISVEGMTAAELEVAARKIPFFRGFGRADKQQYIHVDCRTEFAQWCYAAGGASCPYYPPVKA